MNTSNNEIVTKLLAKVKLLRFPVMGDDRGSLIPLEEMKEIPFKVKRIYYIYDTKNNVTRGHHAHKNLKQILISVSGSVNINCEFGNKKQTFHLSSPNEGLLIEGLVWRAMDNFSDGAVLLVLASELYDEDDYIYNHQDFIKLSTELL